MLPRFLTVDLSLVFATFATNITEPKKESGWNKQLEESNDRQQGFIKLLLPVITEQNQKILRDRTFVDTFFAKYPDYKADSKISAVDYESLIQIAKTYKVSNPFDKKEYFDKIDTIPASLVLSQAALESGWGTSKVSKASNNLFGQKVYGSNRYYKAADSTRYASFDSIAQSVKSYMTNLNSHEAYLEFRKKRADTRSKNLEFTGLKAAKTLVNYSEVKGYTASLTTLIKTYFSAYDGAKSILAGANAKVGFLY